MPDADDGVPEGDGVRGLQGRVGGGARQHRAGPADRLGQLWRGVQGRVAQAVRGGGEDAEGERAGEAEREARGGQEGGVPQGARDHEEAAAREARQALVCVHHW